MTYDVLQGWWTDAGTFPSLRTANDLVQNVELDLDEKRDEQHE